jgi:DNA-binding FadR family transcriptional regulator
MPAVAASNSKAGGDRRPATRFKPIKPLRAHEYVAEQIRRHIALRILQPEECLPSERELAVMFGVGRPTMQQALRLLEAEGLVQARRGRNGGTFVLRPAGDAAAADLMARILHHLAEIEDLLVYRSVIEPAIAKRAASSRRSSDLTAMTRATHAMAKAETEFEYMRADTEFHLAVAAATHNPLLVRAIEELRTGLNDVMTLLPESDTWHRLVDAEHEAIAAAIEAGDEKKALSVTESHVTNSEQGVRAVLAGLRRGRTWLTS